MRNMLSRQAMRNLFAKFGERGINCAQLAPEIGADVVEVWLCLKAGKVFIGHTYTWNVER